MKENSKEEFVFGYNNFTEINRAILQIERKIFKNGKGSVQDKIIDVLKKDLFAGHLSYSCDTEFYFLTPVCDEALALKLEKSGLSNISYNSLNDTSDWSGFAYNINGKVIDPKYIKQDDFLIRDEKINQDVSESWSKQLFNKEKSLLCGPDTMSIVDVANEHNQNICAEYLSREKLRYRNWPIQKIIEDADERPITNYLKIYRTRQIMDAIYK